MRLALALIAAALALPATASGGLSAQQAEQVAAEHWGHWPDCPNGIALTWSPDLGTVSGQEVYGRGWDCHLWLNSRAFAAGWGRDRRRDESLCLVVIHEWGHLLGLAHSADPRSIMYPSPPWTAAPECERRHRFRPALAEMT